MKTRITTKRLAAILWWFEGDAHSDPASALRTIFDYGEVPLEHIAQNFEEQADRETRKQFLVLAKALRG